MATVLLVSSVDTREKEILFLKGLIEGQGSKVLVMDLSMGAYKEGAADYTCLDVAKEAGVSFQEIAAEQGHKQKYGIHRARLYDNRKESL